MDVLLPFDEVVAALGHRGEQYLGLQSVDLDAIVGSVDRRTGFDRQFRPTSDLTRDRFERLAVALLAEGVEAWGFRRMQERGELLDRKAVALLWFSDEYEPVLALLREAGLHPGDGTLDAEVYLQFARERYHVLRTHRWDDSVITRLQLREGRERS